MNRIASLSPRQNLIVAAVVRAVAAEALWDTLARAIAVRAGRCPDHERLLFAIVDGLEDHKLTAPGFIIRQTNRILNLTPLKSLRSPFPAPARAHDDDDGTGDFAADVSLYAELD